MNDTTHPCLNRLDAACFAAHPEWARQAFAYRLLHLLIPKALSKKLPRILRDALIAPDVVIPNGVEIPDGAIVAPGTDIPADWDVGYAPTSGLWLMAGQALPEDWAPGDPLPEADSWGPGAFLPEDWQPGDALPEALAQYLDLLEYLWSLGALGAAHLRCSPTVPVCLPCAGAISPEAGASVTGTEDGRVKNKGYGWLAVHGATSGTLAHWTGPYSNEATLAYHFSTTGNEITRSFLTFDLSGLPSDRPSAVRLQLTQYGYHDSAVSVQQGTHTYPIYTSHYDSFIGDEFGHADWQEGINTIDFNDDGIDYIQTVLGSTAKLCIREYDHDYNILEPDLYARFRNGFYYSEATQEANRPVLVIEY